MPEQTAQFDPGAMGDKIREFGVQILRGWKIGSSGRALPQDFNAVVFSGMGGSAIAGDVILSMFRDALTVPFIVNRSYTVPGFVSEKTLFIASSYSGNTEETLSALNAALDRGACIAAVTSGGEVLSMCSDRDFPVYSMPPGYPPRSALGFPVGILLAVFSRSGLIPTQEADVQNAVSFLAGRQNEFSHESGPCAVLAESILGRLPFVYGAEGGTDVAALRWKAQFNENSKVHAVSGIFSEMNHNEIMGWSRHRSTGPFFDTLSALFLRVPGGNDRNSIRMDITRDIIQEQGGAVHDIAAQGSTKMEQLLYLISYGDWTSYHLARLQGVDPTEIPAISTLKNKLSKVK